MQPFKLRQGANRGYGKTAGSSGMAILDDDSSTFGAASLPPDPDAGLSTEQKAEIERKLVRKLDCVLLPWLCFLYLICFLDRTNIGNAKIARLTKDVPMDAPHYSLTLTIFFVAYAIFEALANYLLKRFKPSRFFPVIMVLTGILVFSTGFIHDWSELMAIRWFLGAFEAGLFPGVNFYLSCWYLRREFALRASIFFSAAAVSGSFGGFLAAAIQTMDGMGGRPGWAWIFIIEGILTVIVGTASFWMVQDFPDEAKFLSEDDRARVIRRLRLDNQSSADHEDFRIIYLWQALTDWKTYAGMFLYMGPLMPLYSFSLFLPTIITNLGSSFTTEASITRNQLLTVPPYAGAAVLTVVVGYLSDRYQKRGLFNLCVAPIGCVGFTMLAASENADIRYAGTFLGALGIYPTIPIIIAWVANNTEGVYKRGIVLGMVIGWGNLHGVVSSNMFSHGPRFVEAYVAIIAYMAICTWGGSLAMWALLRRENAFRQAGRRDERVRWKTHREIAEMGDMRPEFRYTV